MTDTGPYGDHRYFLRLAAGGDPNDAATYDLNNGSLSNVDQRRVVDTGFLELTRLGALGAGDPDVARSLAVVDSVLRRATPSGPGWHRYGVEANGSTDGYGDCYEPDPTHCAPSGAPSYNAVGSGHLWPTLDGERAEQAMQTGAAAEAGALALAMRRMSWGTGLMPEQAWEDPNIPRAPYGSNPATASIGFVDGKAAGSATPLIWAEGQYVRLVRDVQTGTLVDQPAITRGRYLGGGWTSALPVAITAPAAGAHVGGTTVGERHDVAGSRGIGELDTRQRLDGRHHGAGRRRPGRTLLRDGAHARRERSHHRGGERRTARLGVGAGGRDRLGIGLACVHDRRTQSGDGRLHPDGRRDPRGL